jgi:hypothetical protein
MPNRDGFLTLTEIAFLLQFCCQTANDAASMSSTIPARSHTKKSGGKMPSPPAAR